VTDNGLLLVLREDGGALTCTSLIQGLACSSHDGDENLLLSVRGSGGDLSYGRSVVLLPLSGNALLINGDIGGVVRHGRQDGGGGGQW
jgi:hypothetical protein